MSRKEIISEEIAASLNVKDAAQYALSCATGDVTRHAADMFINSKDKFSKENLINLAVAFGMEEIRKVVSTLISSISSAVQNAKYGEFLNKIWNLLLSLAKIGKVLRFINIYKYFWKSKKQPLDIVIPVNPPRRHINFIPSSLFWTVLYMHINDKDNASIRSNNVLIRQLNKEEYIIEFLYKTVSVEYKNHKYLIEDIKFDVQFKDKNISNILGKFDNLNIKQKFSYENFSSFLDFIPRENVRKDIIENFNIYYTSLCNKIGEDFINNKGTYIYTTKIKGTQTDTSSYAVSILLDELKALGVFIDPKDYHRLIHELVYILSFVSFPDIIGYDMENDFNRGYILLKNCKIIKLFGIDITAYITSASNRIKLSKFCASACPFYDNKILSHVPYINSWIYDQLREDDLVKNIDSKQEALSVIIASAEASYDDAIKVWCEFITCFENLGKEAFRKVKVFNLKLEKIIDTIEIDNPEYIKWKEENDRTNESDEKHEAFNTDEELSDEDHIDKKSNKHHSKKSRKSRKHDIKHDVIKEMFGYIRNNAPNKTIKSEKIIKNVVQSEVNDVYKNFDTLYLREECYSKLSSIITKFRDNREEIENLGLRYKMCVLLYGAPGTGKSSTIAAVASFLGKNIYYVNFTNVETNEDMHLLFDYVQKHCANGGMIVMEDIDSMTKIVHQRAAKPDSELTISNLVNSKQNSLTLEYMLNLLDGTLTKDGLVFFATTNHIEILDEAFIRAGRFETIIHLQKADKYQISTIYKRFFGDNINPKILNRIPEDKYTPAEIIDALRCYVLNKEDDEIMLKKFLINPLDEDYSEFSDGNISLISSEDIN